MKTLYATVASLALAAALPMMAGAQDTTAGQKVDQAVDATVQGAKDAANAVADAAKDAADAVSDGAAATEDAAKDAAKAAEETAEDAAKATEDAAKAAEADAKAAEADAKAAADQATDQAATAAAEAEKAAAVTDAMFDTGLLGEHSQLASSIIGREIWTTAGTEAQPLDEMAAIESVPAEWKTIGSVGDMVMQDGGLVAYVADVGGFLGLGSKPVLLKSDTLKTVMVGDKRVFVTGYSEEALKALPEFQSEAVEAK